MLFVERVGNGSPVALVHGFTQTRRSWQPVVDRLHALNTFALVDAPGHGRSSDVHVDLRDGARLLGESAGRGSYVGYSMGGRLSLHLAIDRPDLVDGLVLIGTNPGIKDETQRAIRRAADDALADRLEAEGVPAFVDWWLRQPLFQTLNPHAADREERLTNTASGLAASLRLAGAGSRAPLWDRLGELSMPVLVMAGELDTKYVAIARDTVNAIGRNAELVLIPGAGHACHLERPDPFCVVLADFLGHDS
jgi:2-succinyl-6-hydroxy-2,4-cyclohexadiene-1-carboxylate synthase